MDTERPIIIPVYYEEWFAGSSFALVKDIPDGMLPSYDYGNGYFLW